MKFQVEQITAVHIKNPPHIILWSALIRSAGRLCSSRALFTTAFPTYSHTCLTHGEDTVDCYLIELINSEFVKHASWTQITSFISLYNC